MPRTGDEEEAIAPHETSPHSSHRNKDPAITNGPRAAPQPPHHGQPTSLPSANLHPIEEEPYTIFFGFKVPSQSWTGPLVDNNSSDARDHCANERTFLSYLRLSIYMCIVAIAIVISFHLKAQPTNLELRIAKPLGIIFWCLSVACLALGVGNYVKTARKYSRRMAIVQSGWKTQSVFILIAFSIVGVCILFLATNSSKN